MTSFYLSPSGLTYRQYSEVGSTVLTYGWRLTYAWPRDAFLLDYNVKDSAFKKIIRALALTDIYIAVIPATNSGGIELGLAHLLCEELFLAARDRVFFTHTGLADAYLPALSPATKCCCKIKEIPAALKKEYAYLIG